VASISPREMPFQRCFAGMVSSAVVSFGPTSNSGDRSRATATSTTGMRLRPAQGKSTARKRRTTAREDTAARADFLQERQGGAN
jgi:hypothetical protein